MIVGVRHAEVENPDGLVYARLPGFHLSEKGRRAAGQLADGLVEAPVRAVYASPLDRAKETASILAGPHGLSVMEDDRLLEWSFWVRWQGLPWSRIRKRDPELLETYAADPASANPEDSLEATGRGVLDWANDAWRGEHDADEIVLGVTHEAPLAAAFLVGRGASVNGVHAMNLPHLSAVRLLPGPPELVDLAEWARRC